MISYSLSLRPNDVEKNNTYTAVLPKAKLQGEGKSVTE